MRFGVVVLAVSPRRRRRRRRQKPSNYMRSTRDTPSDVTYFTYEIMRMMRAPATILSFFEWCLAGNDSLACCEAAECERVMQQRRRRRCKDKQTTNRESFGDSSSTRNDSSEMQAATAPFFVLTPFVLTPFESAFANHAPGPDCGFCSSRDCRPAAI